VTTETVYAYLTDVAVSVGGRESEDSRANENAPRSRDALFVALLVLTGAVIVAEDRDATAALLFVGALCAGFVIYRCVDISLRQEED